MGNNFLYIDENSGVNSTQPSNPMKRNQRRKLLLLIIRSSMEKAGKQNLYEHISPETPRSIHTHTHAHIYMYINNKP